MKRSRGYMAMLLAVLAMGAVHAQETNKKLYRWVDKQGHVHYDDALPPEAVNQALQVFSAKSGNVTGTVDRALTPEERVQQIAEQKRAVEQASQTEQKTRTEEAMLASYQTIADLRRAYEERVGLLKQTLESTEASLKSLHSTIIAILVEASENELNQQPVDAKQASTLLELHNELLKQQVLQGSRKTELATLEAEFQNIQVRFNELRTAPATPSDTGTDAGAPPDVGTPPVTPPEAKPH